MPSVDHIHVASTVGAPMQEMAEIEALADRGLVGDRKFDSGRGRDITVVSREELAEAERELGAPIPPGSTRRQVTVSSGILPRTPGAVIILGDVAVEVLQDCAPCEKMEMSVGPGARAALRHRAGIRGRIVSGGVLRVGDEVRFDPSV